MNQSSSVPEPIVLPLQSVPTSADPVRAVERHEAIELRSLRVEEFLQARSLAPNTQKAYRQDLQQFLSWTNKGWAEVTPRRIAQFKAYLLRQDLDSGQRVLSDTTIRRILGMLKNFYGWMVRVRYLAIDPTVEVELPKLTEPEAQNLQEEEVVQIYQAVAGSSLPERNMALISVLLHGLRAEEVCALNIEDYDGRRLHIREAKADSKGFVPLTTQAKQDLEQDLQWRQEQGRVGQRFVRNCITTALKALLYRLSIVSKNAFQINLKKCNLYLKGKQCKELNSTLWTKFGLREKLILVVHCKILCFFLT